MTTIPLYIWLTLLSCVLHAFSFTYSKQFLVHSDNRLKLAFYSQFAVGILGFCFLPFVGIDSFFDNIGLICLMGICVMVGQVAYMNALRFGDASFVVPMLGLKMFVVAGLSATLLSETYGTLVYVGAFGVFVSLFFLNDGKLTGSSKALMFVMITCVMFGCADVIVMSLLKNGVNGFQIAAFVFAIPTLVLLPISPILFKNDWKITPALAKTLMIYAVIHLIGVTLLMVAFKLSQQVTIINIVQSARGLVSIGVVYVMARMGFSGIEKLTRRQLTYRGFGGLLMFLSLGLAVVAH
ncbi:MAG: EamA family transporter [Immundisolibacteraceae bacterium]|nr:EamA family transporter [Immundisolibacteraceae bacterium]